MSIKNDGWKKIPSWALTQRFYKKDLSKSDNPMLPSAPPAANLISSVFYQDGDEVYHRPVLDIDMDAWLGPSTTPGHYHLIIDKPMKQEAYEKLLEALVEAGILQQGIIDLQWNKDGLTALRVPGEKKTVGSPSSGGTYTKSESVGNPFSDEEISTLKAALVEPKAEKTEETAYESKTATEEFVNINGKKYKYTAIDNSYEDVMTGVVVCDPKSECQVCWKGETYTPTPWVEFSALGNTAWPDEAYLTTHTEGGSMVYNDKQTEFAFLVEIASKFSYDIEDVIKAWKNFTP